MKCPACFNQLTSFSAGTIVVDACYGGCGGVWLDAFELQKVDERHEAGNVLLDIRREEKVVVDSSRKRECPRCPEVKLHRHFFSAKRRVQVDQCPNCAGYWLDAGELEQIQLEKAEDSLENLGRSSTISGEFIRYLYRLESQRDKEM